VRVQFLTAASMKMTAFWDTVLCSLVEVDRRFRVRTFAIIRAVNRPDGGGSTNS
jgi:hypothetical protein